MNSCLPACLAEIMTRDVHYVDAATPLQTVARRMSDAGISSLIVGSPGASIGIVTESNMLRALHWRLPGSTPISELMSKPLISAPQNLDLISARKLLDTHRIRHLAISDDQGSIVGIVSDTDFRRHLGTTVFSRLNTLESAMDREMPRLPPDAPLAEALTRMLQLACDYALVGEHGMPLGIVTERDIPRLLAEEHDAAQVPLTEAMSSPVFSIDIEEPVSTALTAMNARGVRHMVVIGERQQAVGIISQQRLFEQLALHDMEVALGRLCEERDRLRLQAQLNLALSAAGAGGWEYRPAQDRLLYGESLARLLGEATPLPPGNRQAWLGRIHPDDREAYTRAFDALLDGHCEHFLLEYRISHADGRWLWVEDRGCASEREAGGKVVAYCGIIADIGQRHAEACLGRRQNRALRLLGDVARKVLRCEDETTLIAEVCRQLQEIGGYRQAVFAAGSPDDEPAQATGYVLPVGTLNNRFGRIVLDGPPDAIDPGEEARLLGDLADELATGIDKLRSRRLLAESEASLRKLSLAIEQSPHAVIIVNRAQQIEYVNRAFETITGHPPAEASGRDITLLTPLVPPGLIEEIDACLRRGEIWHGEIRVQRHDGTPCDTHAIITPVRQPAGEASHYLAILEDITDKKRNLAELVRYREQLEALVAQRTRQLLQAKEEAEAASRAKSRFLANMGHEIRTPMNAILGLTHLLQRDISDTAAGERLARIGDAANQLMQLLNDILDLSRLEAGNLTLENGEFRLSLLIAEVLRQHGEAASAKGIVLEHAIDPALPPLLTGDAARLRQILLQLLSNAVKFTEQGSIRVAVEDAGQRNGARQLRFSVRDTGIGIRDEIRARLFHSFEQADDSTTRRHGGVGLGLAISRRLVELLGGRIGVEANPEGGSEFWFTLPLRQTEETLAAPAGTPPAPGSSVGEILARIPGLDSKQGLHAVRDKLPTYQRLLLSFAGSHAGDFAQMRALLAGGNAEEARRLAHSIKGAAATLGATRVFETAAAVDHAIREEKTRDEVLPLIDSCATAYQALRDALAELPDAAPVNEPGPAFTPAQLRQRLLGLVQQLAGGDFAVQARLQEDAPLLRAALGAGYPAFEQRIAEFDFATAAELLAQALDADGRPAP